MAQARLRKAVKYPEEDDVPEVMDEQEQEQLIAKLRKENADKNLEYLKLYVAITATSATLFMPIFFRTRLAKPKYLAVAGITSLILTIYMLVLIPTKGRLLVPATATRPAAREPLSLSPLQRWTPVLNAPLSALILYMGLEFRDSPRVHEGYWMICCLPLAMYIIIQFVRRFVVEVDVDELDEMRYEYKGA